MKTQIAHLINGCGSVRRDLRHEKYANATRSSGVGDFAGTSQIEREKIARKVISENENELSVLIAGKQFVLKKEQSVSGKTTWYSCGITKSQYKAISGYAPHFDCESTYGLMIGGSMKVILNKFTRKTAGHQWVHRGYDHIGEEFVTIL